MKKTTLLAQAKQADPLCKAPLVELAGDCRMVIENHLGVLAYSTEDICVKVKYGCIAVQGDCLCLRDLSKEQLVITGRIDSVRLCRR